MKIRKITAAVLAWGMVLLCGCGGNEETGEVSSVPEDSAAVSVTADSEVVTSEESTSEEVRESEAEIEITEITTTVQTSDNNEEDWFSRMVLGSMQGDYLSYIKSPTSNETFGRVAHDYIYHLNEEDYSLESETIEIEIDGWGDDKYGYDNFSTYGFVDLSTIADYKNLKRLYVSHNTTLRTPVYLINYGGLEELDGLEEVSLHAVEFNDSETGLIPLGKCRQVRSIRLESYDLDNWDFLNELTNTVHLELEGCNISDVSFINYMESLKEVWLRDNDIQNYDALEGNLTVEHFESLENFYLKKFEDISNLKKIKSLKYLCVSEYFDDKYTKEDFQNIRNEFQEALPDTKIYID